MNQSQSTPRKPPGWHSRRHQSRKAQDEARENYFATHASARARLARRTRRQRSAAVTTPDIAATTTDEDE